MDKFMSSVGLSKFSTVRPLMKSNDKSADILYPSQSILPLLLLRIFLSNLWNFLRCLLNSF